jgi:inhibitor of KinA sporulation pathway (predicted exonuclease)
MYPTDFRETIILLDTEFTAWEGSQEREWSGENEYREIVQIAAIRVDAVTLKELDSFSIFVKPKMNPKLSDYFIDLTGITQEKVDNDGIDFTSALALYKRWVGDFDTYSFGGDEVVIKENCELYNTPFLFPNRFFDIRTIFQKYGIPAKNYNSGSIVQAFGEEPTRQAHEALNDVRTILDGLRLLYLKHNAS